MTLREWTTRVKKRLSFRCLAVFFSLPDRIEPIFPALGPVRRALHQLTTDQFDHGLLRSIAFAIAQADDAGVASIALAETGAEFIEQLLH